METAGLPKDQLKAKFDKQIQQAKADMAKDKDKIDKDMHHRKHHDKK